tara:strand:+ start:461 stop:4492 length:4032 start_codon:yes stop_codon:yes gene_type:complete
MPVFNNSLAGAAGAGGAAGYKIEKSLRLNSSDESKLTRTPSTEGNTKTWTLSWWMKAPEVDSTIFAAGNGNTPGRFSFGTNGNGAFFAGVVDNNSSVFSITTDAFFRDPSAWYHCCLVCDSTASTQADRFKIIVNGVRQTVTGTLMPQNQNTFVNTTQKHQWSGRSYLDIDFADGYLADIQFVDGQALAPTDFAEEDDNGVWQAKEFTGDYNFTPTVTYPAVYVSSPGTYGTVTDVNTVNGSVFTSAGSSGAGSIRVEFSPAIYSVNKVKFKGGGYSSAATFGIKVNGITTHSNLSTNSSYTAREEALTSATDITSFEIFSASDGWALGDLQFSTDNGTTYTAPSGTAAVIPNSGVNGFHLDFSDNSSNAALGFDALVSGTRYSADWSGSLANNYTFATLFDGNTSTLCLGANGATLTWTPSTPIAWTDAAGGVEVYYHNTSQPDKARVNGGSWLNQVNNSGGWEKVTTGDGTLTKLELKDQATSEVAVYAIRVNGTILTDPAGANDWTVTNLTAYKAATGAHGVTRGTSTLNYDPSVILDGDITTHYADRPINGNGVNFTGIPAANTQLRVRFHYIQSGTMTTNGGHVIASGNQNGAWVEPSGISYPFTLTSISVTGGSANDGFGIAAIEVDGTVLTLGSGASTDSLIDTPTSYEADSGNNGGNYCTWNPLDKNSNLILSNGNLEVSETSGLQMGVRATQWLTSGKWYWEIELVSSSSINAGGQISIGVVNENQPLDGQGGAGAPTGSVVMWPTGAVYKDGLSAGTNNAYNQPGTVVGVALDMDNKTVSWYINGSLQSVSITGLESRLTPFVHVYGPDNDATLVTNFGQRPFKYTNAGTDRPAATYLSLCTQNLDDPLIAKGSDYFQAKTYSGSNSSQSITTNFSPDLTWIKNRSTNSTDHILGNSLVPGAHLYSNGTWTEGSGRITSLNSDGFTVGTHDTVNQSGDEYISWNWDAGSSDTSVSIGGLNSSVYDQRQTWSDYITSSNGWGDGPDHTFDGVVNGSGGSYNNGGGGTLTYTHPVAETVTSLRLRLYSTSDVSLGGGTAQSIAGVAATGGWTTVDVGNGFDFTGSNTMTITRSSGYVYIDGIEINGKELVDDNQTPPNVPKIATTYRANPTAGFSIVNASVAASLTGGPTLAHGLNKKPEFILGKNRDSTIYWYAYHKDLTENHYLIPHLTNAQQNSGAVWGSHSSLDSNVFQIGADTPASMWIPSGTNDCIFYVWTSVENYSSFGKYTGNGSSDGPFVFTGFRVAWLLIKNITTGGETWTIHDSSRDVDNPAEHRLLPNSSDAESTGTSARYKDLLSNGFKIRGTSGEQNTNGDVYIYAAFAEYPFSLNGGLAR